MAKYPKPPMSQGTRKIGPPKPARKRGQSLGDKIIDATAFAIDPAGIIRKGKLKKIAGQMKPVRGASSASKTADSARKTKQAQSIAMGKVTAKKQAAVQSKRATGAAVKAATKKKLDNKRKTGFYAPKGK